MGMQTHGHINQPYWEIKTIESRNRMEMLAVLVATTVHIVSLSPCSSSRSSSKEEDEAAPSNALVGMGELGMGRGQRWLNLTKKSGSLKGPPVDNGFHQVDKSHDHEADEEEGDERPQVVPSYHEAIAQAA